MPSGFFCMKGIVFFPAILSLLVYVIRDVGVRIEKKKC